MVKHQRADTGLGIHHHAFGELHANLPRLEQLPETRLVVEVRAGGIAEAVALPAVARGEAILHRQLGRVGEAPLLANAAMQPFGAPFGVSSARACRPWDLK